MSRWTLFLMSMGFLCISISYMASNPMVFIISGVCIVVISAILLLRHKKK